MNRPFPPVTLGRILRVTLSLSAVLAGVVGLSLALGPVSMGPLVVFKGLLAGLPFPGLSDPLTQTQRAILFSIRFPRIILAVLVGASLSCAGVVFQALFRNPLADPYVLGVSGGAAAGAVLALGLGLGSLAGGISGLAFAGAFVSLLLVFLLSGVAGHKSLERVLLSGVIVNAFFSAIIMFLVSITSRGQIHGAVFWLMGDLAMAEGEQILLVALSLGLGFTAMFLCSRDLNILLAGEKTALQLGVPVRKTRIVLIVSASLVTGAAVSVSGIIGFVGLMVPHLARILFGADHRVLLPASLLFGGAFLAAADTVARTALMPAELPIGVVTALCGAPYFAFLLKRTA